MEDVRTRRAEARRTSAIDDGIELDRTTRTLSTGS
jgi:hypothetical protein